MAKSKNTSLALVTNIGLLTSKLKGTVGGKELLKQTSLLEFGSDITVEI